MRVRGGPGGSSEPPDPLPISPCQPPVPGRPVPRAAPLGPVVSATRAPAAVSGATGSALRVGTVRPHPMQRQVPWNIATGCRQKLQSRRTAAPEVHIAEDDVWAALELRRDCIPRRRALDSSGSLGGSDPADEDGLVRGHPVPGKITQ
jgi:hypothetical protein